MLKKSPENILSIVTIVVCLIIIFLRLFVGSLVIVSGSSMNPTFKDWDFIFCENVKSDTKLSVGDIIVFNRPDTGKTLIKRIAECHDNDCYYVLGDNRNNSVDSRVFGDVEKEDIRFRYVGIRISSEFLYIVPTGILSIILIKYFRHKKKAEVQ